ncbi:DoxX family protein [Neolewinella litorea]|nr:DoxX family protein [Neolewinella litorea]
MMLQLHDPGISQVRRAIGYLLSFLPSLAVLGSGMTKFWPDNEIHALLAQLGMGEYAIAIGLTEIACVLLYWIPRTSNLGFFLFCSYVGGITVAELILDQVPWPGLTIGAMIYAGTLLRKPSLLG